MNFQWWYLFEVVLAVCGVMLLDVFRKAWRGWGYYGLAFLTILAVFIVYAVAMATLVSHHHG